MHIQYASHLHLERYGSDKVAFQPMLKPVAPFLALAGNIGNTANRTYRDLFTYCSRNWLETFLVMGPTELNTEAQCKSLANEFRNVHILHRDRVDRRGVAFLGATASEHDAEWLDRAITDCEEEGRPAVVLTHYLMPSSIRMIRSPVRAWISGHTQAGTHMTWICPNTDSFILGVTNPFGNKDNGYSREIFVDISTVGGNGGDTRDPLLVASAS